jgi:hypothetical protein
MEDIVHFRHVDEKFYRLTEVLKSEPMPDDMFRLFECESEPKTETITTEINETEFLDCLSKNLKVSNYRKTYVVSEDLTKNTVSLKCFELAKVKVAVKKSNCARLQFKKTKQLMLAITINKTTGEFSFFRKSQQGKKTFINIRKNIITETVKRLIRESFASGLNMDATNQAVTTFYQLLGYRPLIDYVQFMECYLPAEHRFFYDHKITDSISTFPFLNYLFKSGIKDLSFKYLTWFEYIFKKDKKLFYNKSIFDYIKYHYEIDNDELFDFLIKEVSNVIDTQYRQHMESVDPNFTLKLPGINYYLIKFIKKYNIYDGDKVLPYVTNSFYGDLNYSNNLLSRMDIGIKRMVDYYGFNWVDVIRFFHGPEEDSYKKTNAFDYLTEFASFSTKLKIRKPILLTATHYKIFDALCVARFETGAYHFNDNFILNLKKLLGTDLKLFINYNITPKEAQSLFTFANTTSVKQYLKDAVCAELCIYTLDNKLVFNCRISESYISKDNYLLTPSQSKGNGSGKEKYVIVNEDSEILRKINSVRNYLDSVYNNGLVHFKQIYSREYFEEYLLNEFGLKATDYLVYTN